jgi:hypothetical protein
MIGISSNTFADFSVSGLRAECSDIFVVEKYNLINEQPKADKYQLKDGSWVLFRSEELVLNCKINDLSVEARLKGKDARAKGACRSNPGAKLTLSINGKEVLKNSLMNNWCYQSLNRIEIKDSMIKICGHVGHDKDKACFTNSLRYLKSVGLPLSPFPMTKLSGE